MKLLLLGPIKRANALRPFLVDDEIAHETELPIDQAFPDAWPNVDFIISYGYRHIIREPWLTKYKGRMINLHIGLLPFNRGADPNYWSWFDDAPKGVGVHAVDSGVDTGPIYGLLGLQPMAGHTLHTSYLALNAAVVALFAQLWPAIRADAIKPMAQPEGCCHGSFHRNGEMPLLPKGWDTPVSEVIDAGRRHRAGQAQQFAAAGQGSDATGWITRVGLDGPCGEGGTRH